MQELEKSIRENKFLLGKSIKGTGKITDIVIDLKDENNLITRKDGKGGLITLVPLNYSPEDLAVYVIFDGFGSNNTAFYQIDAFLKMYKGKY